METMKQKIRETGTLTERLHKCTDMIGDMCKEGRPPKMSIPARWDNEDVYINLTILEAIDVIEAFDYLARQKTP